MWGKWGRKGCKGTYHAGISPNSFFPPPAIGDKLDLSQNTFQEDVVWKKSICPLQKVKALQTKPSQTLDQIKWTQNHLWNRPRPSLHLQSMSFPFRRRSQPTFLSRTNFVNESRAGTTAGRQPRISVALLLILGLILYLPFSLAAQAWSNIPTSFWCSLQSQHQEICLHLPKCEPQTKILFLDLQLLTLCVWLQMAVTFKRTYEHFWTWEHFELN